MSHSHRPGIRLEELPRAHHIFGQKMESKQTVTSAQRNDVESIFNSVSDYISIHDRDFRIVGVNPALCGFLGRTEEELIGKTCYSIFHNRGIAWPNCPQVCMQKKMMPVTELIEDENIGVSLLVTCSPVYGENGDIIGAVHIARNFSKEQDGMRQEGETIVEMRKTLAWLKGLDGILSICASCRRIRNQNGEWERIESFMTDNAGVLFSHGMCPSCFRKLFSDVAESKAHCG